MKRLLISGLIICMLSLLAMVLAGCGGTGDPLLPDSNGVPENITITIPEGI